LNLEYYLVHNKKRPKENGVNANESDLIYK
jgi:hypothetical protein